MIEEQKIAYVHSQVWNYLRTKISSESDPRLKREKGNTQHLAVIILVDWNGRYMNSIY